jgi:hypothetical protein
MRNVEQHTHLPNGERLSLLAATILLAYAVGRFIRLPALDLGVQLPGFYLAFTFNVQMLVSIIVAGLTATGTDWLLRDHPAMRRGRMPEHWMLPALIAWAIGLPLFQMPLSPLWWIGFAFGGAVLILVLVAEYIVVDPDDTRRPAAAAGLTAVSFALYLVLAAALRFAGQRLFLILPAIAIASFLVSLRTLRLRLPERWAFVEAGLAALFTVQLAAALHYWPITPVTYGLALLGPGYALTNFLGNLAAGEPPRQAAVEPAVLLGLIWAAALWIR